MLLDLVYCPANTVIDYPPFDPQLGDMGRHEPHVLMRRTYQVKLTILAIIAIAATAFAFQTGSVQTEPIKVRGCLQGSGSSENPWTLRGAALPAPPAAAPAGNPGGRGDGGARGGGAGGRGRGDAAGQGVADGAGNRGGAGAGRGAGDRGAAPPAAAAAPPQPRIDLRLTEIDMTPWRNMFVEVEGTLGPKPATGLQEFRVTSARSAYGDCPVK
jgi:hypothetical protein